MQRIRTRTELIEAICGSLGQRAITRACHAGTVEVAGGFSRIPPSPLPGWIVTITSVHERTWMVALVPDDHRHTFHAMMIQEIPWKYYVGRDGPCAGEYSVYDGDNPQQACFARELENE